MRFDAKTFIRIAQRDGVEMTRIDENIRIKNYTPEWEKAVVKHKKQLLKHLPEDKETRLQLDLFDED